MPIEFAVLGIILTFIFGTFGLIADIESDLNVTPMFFFYGFSLILCCWVLCTKTEDIDVRRTQKELYSQTIDNIDIITYNGELINLNKKFNRDFEPESVIYEKSGVYVNGLYFGPKLEPAE